MPDIIEWMDESGSQILWRHPKDRLSWGDYLTVRQNQVAVFMKDGKAFDVFQPGSHVIKTSNIPLLTTVLSRIAGYEKDPFHAEIVFVSTSDFKGKFGGRSQTKELAPLQFHGDYIFNVGDYQKFVYEIAGNRGIFTQEAFDEFFRSFFVQKISAALSNFSIVDVLQNQEKTSERVKGEVGKELAEFGINLKTVKFLGIDTTPEYRDRLFWMRAGVSADKLATFSGMEQVAGAMPEGSGAGFGFAGAVFPDLLKKADEAKAQGVQEDKVMIKCNQCGGMFSPVAKFCPHCGDPTDDELKGKKKFCPNCGAEAPLDGKFCPTCGAKLP